MASQRHPLASRVRSNAAFLGLLTALVGLSAATPLHAQDIWGKDSPLHSIQWTDGEKQVDIGNFAEFTVPGGCRFADGEGARDFLRMTQNIPSGDEAGVLVCGGTAEKQVWFVVFSFDASGYVKDDERKTLEAGKILATIREGTAQANKMRKARGWEEMVIDGWVRAPYYDSTTHNLTWSILGHGTESDSSVNHSVRLLGRRGVLHADLVVGPQQLDSVVPAFDAVIASTSFLPGHKYAEWRKGDKVAAYGLTALVAGGAGVAVATKLGLFGKLGKFFAVLFAKLGKLIIAAVVGVVASLKALFRRKREAAA